MSPPVLQTTQNCDSEFDYILLGGGPAGLQMGYEMTRAKNNYIILEKNETAGSFFKEMPKHRTLISINKIYNKFEEPEFNMRHDWNSLLSDDTDMVFKNYSTDLFPHADKVVEYFESYAERFNLNVAYKVEIKSIKKLECGKFQLTDTTEKTWKCKYLLMGLGAMSENLPNFPGSDVIDTYATHTLDADEYKNKVVAILGIGNSAFEVADNLMPYASAVHCYARRPLRLSWDSHFVGDLRAINNNLLDMFHLKSLAGVVNAQVLQINKVTKPCGSTAYDMEFTIDLPQWDPPGTIKSVRQYDKIISCVGWKYVDLNMFGDCCKPEITECGRYPVLDSSWMSNVPNMYFMGTVMQQRDKKAASGFIHGFRYLCRTLHSILNWTNHATIPKLMRFECIDSKALAKFIINRASTSSALYQMNNNVLCDVMVLNTTDKITTTCDGMICGTVEFYYELPYDWVMEKPFFINQEHMFVLSLEDDKKRFTDDTKVSDFRVPQVSMRSADCSGIVRPAIRAYKNGEMSDVVKLGTTLFGRCDASIVDGDTNPERMTAILAQMICQNLGVKYDIKIPTLFGNQKQAKFQVWDRSDINKYNERVQKLQLCQKKTCSFKVKDKYLIS